MKINLSNKFNLNKILILFSLGLFVSTINILRVILGAVVVPAGYSYLAVGHFFMDYFEYVQQIAQGIFGHLLVENQFAIGDPTKTLIGWGQYLFYGKIAAFFHLSATTIYWLVIFILGFLLFLLIYKLIESLLPEEHFVFKIAVLLISLFATPFIIIKSGQIIPYDYWYAPMSFFHRFGGVPHHLLGTIITIISLLMLSRFHSINVIKLNRQSIGQLFVTIILLIFLMSFSPFQVINLISALIITTSIFFINKLRQKFNFNTVINSFYIPGVILIFLVPIGILMNSIHKNSVLFENAAAWEMTQIYHPPLRLILLTLGPLIILVLFGIKSYFKKMNYLRILFLIYILFSYIYFSTNLSLTFRTFNSRFITPLAYILFGVLSLLAVKSIAIKFKQKANLWIIIASAILMIYFIPVNISIYNSVSTLDQLSYIPTNIIDGFKFLNSQKNQDGVLTSPGKSLGLIVPVFADKHMYLGRMIFTPDYDFKLALSERFYKGLMYEQEASQFLIDNHIHFVILTSIEPDYTYDQLEKYSFLKTIYQNKDIKIYQP